MNFTTVNNTLAQHFSTQMASLEPGVTVLWDNARPSASALDPHTSEWCRYSFRPATEDCAALGGRLWRGACLVVVQVFTPLGRGQGPNLDILRNVQVLFRDSSPIGGAWVRPPIQLRQFGEQDGWYQGVATVQFSADESV